MKKFLSVLLSALMILSLFSIVEFSSFASSGTTYFVDSFDGSDDNDGMSEESAWRTLYVHSQVNFEPGDKILLKAGGVYSGAFMPETSGTKESPITISSFGNVDTDGKPLMLSANGEPTIFLLNVSGWDVDGLEFSSKKKDGAGLKIKAVNAYERPVYNYPIPVDEPDEPDEPDTPVEPDPQEPSERHNFNLKEFFKGISDRFDESWQEIRNKIDWIKGKTPVISYNHEYWDALPENYEISDFNITNCVFHDMAFYQSPTLSSNYCPIDIDANGKGSKIRNVRISDIEIYNCGFGIQIDGLSKEFDPEFFISEDESYNHDFIIENVDIRNTGYGAILLGALEGAVVRNCTMFNTCIWDDWYTAPLWTHHCDHVVMENIEVAGTKNWKDGMTVDFDGWTQNSTYQYIYSHDNVCFVKSNNYDNTTKNRNNTVRYCLSVNDNKIINVLSLPNMSERNFFKDRGGAMQNFKFYNNTLINCAPTVWGFCQNSLIANNIFVGNENGLSSVAITINKNTKIVNNCFYGMSPMPGATKNILANPGFIGSDESDKNSFMLSKDSKLIGKGIKADDDMGEHDFFGNPLTDTHNIGCYDASGEEQGKGAFARAFTFIGRFFLWIKTIVAKLFK